MTKKDHTRHQKGPIKADTTSVIIDKIASMRESFSPTNRKIARFVTMNKYDIGFSSTRSLSDKLNVSKASIVRFAQTLGFKGFNDFQKAIQGELKKQLSPYDNILLHDLDVLTQEKQLQKLIANELANLGKTLNHLDVVKVMQVVEHMAGANTIFVSGFGGSKPVAQKLVHSLQIVCDKRIEAITGAVSDFTPALSSLQKNDLVFILTLPAYSREGFHLCKYAKKNQGRVCLITDSAECPLYNSAHTVLLCERHSLTLANSYVGLNAIVQIITDMFFLYCKEEGVRSVTTVRNIEHNVYRQSKGRRRSR